MTREKHIKIINLILIIIWMLTVFMFSNENGDKSQSTSKIVTKAIIRIFTYNQNLTQDETTKLIENTDYIVRKLAHFSIYALGGVLIFNYINTFKGKANKKIVISIVIGVLYAMLDEFHQYFISGRSAQVLDICIDSLGVITGVSLIYIIKKFKKPLNN